jgi:hypothetical protein
VDERLIEMTIGETIRVGGYWVTLLDVDGDKLCLQIESDNDSGWDSFESGAPESMSYA